ncbi:MAG: hypothetical protein VCD33_05625 [Alphaproteobacteria bacterium]
MTTTERGAIRVEAVAGPGAMDRFIRVPFSLYDNDANWVPPLVMERRDHLNPRKNPWFDHGEARYWLAFRGDSPGGRPVGRISAQIDRTHLERYDDGTGHFGFLEGEDDGAVFQALFGAAECWLRERGMSRIRGPFSLSINDESGLLVDGFDTPPSMMMGHAPPYYSHRVEAEGYDKAMDLLAYVYDSHQVMPDGPRQLIERLGQSGTVTLRPLDKRRYSNDLGIILDIFNDAWSRNWGFVPFTAAEVAHLAKELKPLIRPGLVCIAEVDGEPAAMAVSLPNLNEAIADLGGALLPFGWAKLLWRLKVGTLETVRVPLMGVRRQFHGTWQGAALAFAVIDSVHGRLMAEGFKRAEMSWVLETNRPMRRLIEAVGARPYKTYRVYEKALT